MSYKIMWKNEEIESNISKKDLNYLISEYALAFNSNRSNFKGVLE